MSERRACTCRAPAAHIGGRTSGQSCNESGRLINQVTMPPMSESSSLLRFRRYFSSSVGTKLLIGITGLLLFVYLVVHLLGNAMVFAGADVFNEYSHKLISNPLILPIEIGLLLIFLL